MPKAKKPPVHWLRVEATQEAIQEEILDRLELYMRADLVLRCHGLRQDHLCRIDTDRCWCVEPLPITKPTERMLVGRDHFRCVLHGKQISIRRALDTLMKTKEARAKLLEEHPALQGIRDSLFKRYDCFEAGENYVKRSIHEHQPTALTAVMPSPKAPLRGLVIEALNSDTAKRAFESGLEDAPWREGLEDLLDRDGDLEIGWHGGELSLNEKHRRQQAAQLAQYRDHVRGVKRQEAARANEALELLK